MTLLRSFSVLALVAGLGCGGGTPAAPAAPTQPATPATPSTAAVPTTPPATPSAPATGAPAPSETTTAAAPSTPPTVWSATMPKDQQIAFMKTNVIPPMTKVFSEHDATRYGAFGCKTCHGPSFQEPKAFLPHLTFKDGKITSFADKPAVSKWMAEKVVPAMASAMGAPPYDPKTHQGFGCGGCHAVDMK